ncbi:hypothetical protein KY290_037963 [Solanum tuberosum]|uniref:Uncharacterized protein n=1 Tax=Solanum tuberosum TaxID=4113 RepID=A0ABQ7TXN6_SOLTU|nr:hypothetical protein KY284_037327 [Solanum tuberosum]KAH0640733.1 hypothetical protein KY285_037319 [Solanum tuberosum]KAH0739258.1 hypothetical protein KY290_037963 [Solanum tuberosum]
MSLAESYSGLPNTSIHVFTKCRSLSLEVRCLWLLAHSRGLPTSTWFRCPIAPGLELRPPYRGEKSG